MHSVRLGLRRESIPSSGVIALVFLLALEFLNFSIKKSQLSEFCFWFSIRICLAILIVIFMQVNYRIDYSEEIFDDPAAVALLQVQTTESIIVKKYY